MITMSKDEKKTRRAAARFMAKEIKKKRGLISNDYNEGHGRVCALGAIGMNFGKSIECNGRLNKACDLGIIKRGDKFYLETEFGDEIMSENDRDIYQEENYQQKCAKYIKNETQVGRRDRMIKWFNKIARENNA